MPSEMQNVLQVLLSTVNDVMSKDKRKKMNKMYRLVFDLWEYMDRMLSIGNANHELGISCLYPEGTGLETS